MLMKKISYSRMFQRSPSSRNSVLAKQQKRRPQKNLKQSLIVSLRTLRLPLKTHQSGHLNHPGTFPMKQPFPLHSAAKMPQGASLIPVLEN